MLIEVHHGDGGVLLVNGNCRQIHLLDYIRSHCCVSSSINIDLCLVTSGEPFRLSSSDLTVTFPERRRFPTRTHCILARIDEEGTYIPLLNDPSVVTAEFLVKLKKATSIKARPANSAIKLGKDVSGDPTGKTRRKSLRVIAIAARAIQYHH